MSPEDNVQYIHVYIYIYIYIYTMNTYMHVYIYIYIHTHTQACTHTIHHFGKTATAAKMTDCIINIQSLEQAHLESPAVVGRKVMVTDGPNTRRHNHESSRKHADKKRFSAKYDRAV